MPGQETAVVSRRQWSEFMTDEERKEYRRQYMREYNRTHPERLAKNNENVKAYYKNHPNYRKNKIAHVGEFRKNHYLRTSVDGKCVYVYLKYKRPKPTKCELCPKGGFLSYHHWSVDGLICGLWLCHKCHMLAEGSDKGTVGEYLKLKKVAEEEVREKV